jgi:hypothetical protein
VDPDPFQVLLRLTGGERLVLDGEIAGDARARDEALAAVR